MNFRPIGTLNMQLHMLPPVAAQTDFRNLITIGVGHSDWQLIFSGARTLEVTRSTGDTVWSAAELQEV
jgi:hypothetical protein